VYDVITPVPSHYTRRLRRIMHPASVLAWYIAGMNGMKAETLVVRRKKTGYQWKLKKKQRIKNVSGAFAVRGFCSGKKILLVDDIYTTGSTVNECASVLKNCGAELVDVYTLACSGYY
jgi:ComF family protein